MTILFGLLGRVPALAWLLAAALLWGWSGQRTVADLREQLAAIDAEAQHAQGLSEAETKRRRIETEGVMHALKTQALADRTRDAADAAAAARLRAAFAPAAGGGAVPGDPAAGPGGAPAPGVSEVARGCVGRLAEVVAAARDAARRAHACEGAHDALTVGR